MLKKLTKADLEKIVNSRTGVIPMEVISDRIARRVEKMLKEAEVKKQKTIQSNK